LKFLKLSKEKAMKKVMSMQEAVSKYVKSGSTLFIGGMQHGEPSAAVHEIARQKIDHLSLVCCLVVSINVLIGEGRVDKISTAYIAQDIKRSYTLSRAQALGRLPLFEEYSHFGIAQALLAGQMGVSFLPIRSQVGSDMPKYNPNIQLIDDPFSGGKIGAVKAIVPDVGILHVQRCDSEGNAQKWGSLGVDIEGINASRTVIITTEKIVPAEVIRRDPNRTIIPGYRVSAVVEQPWGAHPMHLSGFYAGDMLGFLGELGKQESYEAYVKRLVYGVNTWEEYLKERRAIKPAGFFEKYALEKVASEPIYTGIQAKS
jgi:glutaconate CoA-transferase subunit A